MMTNLLGLLKQALAVKRLQGLVHRVIPVFVGMEDEEAHHLVRSNQLTELEMTDVITVWPGDRDWLQRVMAVIQATPSGEENATKMFNIIYAGFSIK